MDSRSCSLSSCDRDRKTQSCCTTLTKVVRCMNNLQSHSAGCRAGWDGTLRLRLHGVSSMRYSLVVQASAEGVTHNL
eukprot:225133-Rhodomonas_salina.2